MELNFDASTVNPISEAGGFLPVSEDPRGHLVVISEWPAQPTENGKKNGHHVALIVKIIEGPHAGTEGVHRLNMFHEDEGPRKAAYTELAALAYVIKGPNNLRVAHSSELVGKSFRMISVRQKPDDPENTYTQLARNGIRDVNGNRAGEGGGNAPTSSGPAIGGPGNGGNQGQGHQGSGGGQPASGNQGGGWNTNQQQGQNQGGNPGQGQGQQQSQGWQGGNPGQGGNPAGGPATGQGQPDWNNNQGQGQQQQNNQGGGWNGGGGNADNNNNNGKPAWV